MAGPWTSAASAVTSAAVTYARNRLAPIPGDASVEDLEAAADYIRVALAAVPLEGPLADLDAATKTRAWITYNRLYEAVGSLRSAFAAEFIHLDPANHHRTELFHARTVLESRARDATAAVTVPPS